MMNGAWDTSKLYPKAYPCIPSMSVKVKMGSVASIPEMVKLKHKAIQLRDDHFEIYPELNHAVFSLD